METIKGLEKLLKDLDKFPKEIEAKLEGVLEDNARQVERSAKRNAPVDTGKLRQSIIAAKNGELSWRIYVSAKYGAYMEFGTGGLVKVPPELQDLAIQFKGKGVKRIDLRPRPYLYPAFDLQRGQLLKDIEQLLTQELNKV